MALRPPRRRHPHSRALLRKMPRPSITRAKGAGRGPGEYPGGAIAWRLFLDGNARGLDHRTPFGHLGGEEAFELTGRRADHEQREFLEPPPDGRIGERRRRIGVHLW